MADFHLGQHLLFRRHAYTVTCHLAPGALRRPTLPPRDGPPFCSVLKMISMHEISWGAHKLFPLLCIPVWIFPRSVSVNVCAVRARVAPGCMFECAYCSSARACVFNGGFARCRGEHDLNGDIRCPFCVWNCSALLLSLRRTLIASQSVCGVYSNARFATQTLHVCTRACGRGGGVRGKTLHLLRSWETAAGASSLNCSWPHAHKHT